MQYGCLKLVHFSKKSGRLSSTGSEILTFGSHCSANFQPILDCFIPKFKLEYDDLEHIKTDCVNAVIFNLHQIKRLKFFFGTPGTCKQLAVFRIPWRAGKLLVTSYVCSQSQVMQVSAHGVTYA